MGVGFRPLGEIVHIDQEKFLSLVAQRESSSYIECYRLGCGPFIVFVHLAPIPCPQEAICGTDVALSAPCLDMVSCLNTIVPLPNFIQGFIGTQVTS
jgi:hypothetical protein